MELKYYTILTSPQYNNPSLLVKDWNKENYPFGFGGLNHDGTECIWAGKQEVYLKKDVDEAIAELKKKLESVQASMYCDVVDANMENRRLRRALWIARAERAKYRVEYWACRGGTLLEHYPFCVNGDSPFNRLSEMGCLYGDTNERLKEAKFKHLYASEWMLVWENVERKCRAKAEEYK